jgi:hypothetical protein
MSATDLNTVRKTIEETLINELENSPPIPIVFNNMPYISKNKSSYVQCLTTFGSSNYLTQGSNTNSTNNVTGLLTLNIYTEEGVGSGENLIIGKRLRNLYNRTTISNVIFDAPVGPEISQSTPEGKFQTQIRITFEIYETLSS